MKQQRQWSWRSPQFGLGLLIFSLPALPAIALEKVSSTEGPLLSSSMSDPRAANLSPMEPGRLGAPQTNASAWPSALGPAPSARAKPGLETVLGLIAPEFSAQPGLSAWVELTPPAVWPGPRALPPSFAPPGPTAAQAAGDIAQGIDAVPGEGGIDSIPLPETIDPTAESLEAIPNAPQDIPLIPGLDTPTVLPEQDPTAPLPGGGDRLDAEPPPSSPVPGENGLGENGLGENDLDRNGFDQDPSLEEIFPAGSMEGGEGDRTDGGDGNGNGEGAETEGTGSDGDPDLGVLRVRERPLATRNTRTTVPVYLVGNISYTGNDNTLAGIDPVDDRFFRSSIALIASPRLSRRTALIGSIQGSLNRYNELSRVDYNELSFQASLRQVLLPRLYGDIGWTHRNLYLDSNGDRFLKEHAAFVSLTRRDPLNAKTTLTSFYNLRMGFADPDSSSRLRNTLGTSLRYDITPRWQTSLTGRLTLTNFTQQERQDFYGQTLLQLSYKISQNARFSLFGSLIRGNSSNRRVDFDSSTLGLSFNTNLQLF